MWVLLFDPPLGSSLRVLLIPAPGSSSGLPLRAAPFPPASAAAEINWKEIWCGPGAGQSPAVLVVPLE